METPDHCWWAYPELCTPCSKIWMWQGNLI